MSGCAWDLQWSLTDMGDLRAELALLKGEALGWQPLEAGAYLHVGNRDEEAVTIAVTGVPDASLAGMNVLLLT